MSARKNITVKDVALKCGASRSLVAAVLSDAVNNIGCSEQKREKILRVGKEMNYHPNLFARAMKTGVSPLVAVCMHVVKTRDDEINVYIHDLLPNLTWALLTSGFHTIFIPYENIEDFIEQTKKLASNNLISGIITNFSPEHVNETISHLKEVNMPFVLMGKVMDKSIVSVYIENTVLSDALYDYALTRGYKRTLYILAKRNEQNEIYWESSSGSDEMRRSDINDFTQSDILLVAMGELTRRMLIEEFKINERNIISIESKKEFVQFHPTVLVNSKEREKAAIAAKALSEWIRTGQVPTVRQNVIKLNPKDIQFIL